MALLPAGAGTLRPIEGQLIGSANEFVQGFRRDDLRGRMGFTYERERNHVGARKTSGRTIHQPQLLQADCNLVLNKFLNKVRLVHNLGPTGGSKVAVSETSRIV